MIWFDHKKYEASFMVFLIVVSTIAFSFSINSKQVIAVPNACCEKTRTGEFCQYTDASNCDPNGKISYTGCEQTSYCKVGCCFSSDEGRCFKNTPRSTCELSNQTWRDNADCSIQQCTKGCCVLGTETFYVTQVRCKKETSKFPYANMTFLNAASEQECLDRSKSLEKGACVLEDGTCTFTTRGNCNVQNQQQIKNLSVGFYRDMLCSNDKLGASCAKQHRTACLGEDVYWFDSCGNQENIYSSNKEASYNNGFILNEQNSCVSSGANDPNCGNCDYLQGNLCGKAENNTRPIFGDYICKNLDCSKTTKSISSPNAGVPHKYGESWCLYDAAVGQARDVVGSRHYRALCIGGEETIEECKDYREEMCVQGVVGTEPQPNEIAFKARGSFVEAKCRENRNKECNACNTKESCGGECSGLEKDELKKCCAKKCCQNNDLRDCYWLEAGISSLGGVCVPEVPPGLKFWPGETSDKNTNSAPQSDAAKVCEQASNKCTVTYKTGGIGKIFGSEKKECVGNCFCLEHSWIVAANTACKAQGDCGAWYNIAGKLTTDGFSSSKGKLTQADVERWDVLAGAPSKYKAPGFFKELSKRGILQSIIGIALVGGISAVSGAGISKGFSSAFNPISGTLFGAIGTGLQQSAINAFGGSAVLLTKGATIDSSQLASRLGMSPDKAFEMVGGKIDLAKPSQTLIDGATKQGFSQTVDGKFIANQDVTLGNTGIAQGLQVINTILWIYTLYQIADYILTKTKTEDIVVTCSPWVAPEGGGDCEKCNKGPLKCSEYKCRSLGQTCKLINTGTSNEKCVNVAPNDVTSPIISPWKEAITVDYQNIEQITNERGEKGYRIVPLIKPFTPITLGIKTNEPAQCKYGLNHSIRYDKMADTFFGDSLYDYNHTLTFSLPSELTQDQVLKLTNGGIFNLYIRCKDASGNANERDYFIRFQIDKGPDLTPPVITATSILNNAFIPYGINSSQLSIYVNEPATCKWDRRDTEYEIMNNSFTCATTGSQISAINYGTYECRTTIDGIKSPQTDYFFRCKDKPSAPEKERNVNSESYKFTLRGTEKPLRQVSIEPSGILYNANPIIKIITEGGSSSGAAACAYSNQNVQFNNMILFLETNGTIHRQPLNLTTGNYQYFIRCQDVAGNELSTNTTFTVAVDTTPPRITQIYKDVGGSILHITMNEDSSCEFSTVDQFHFGDGTPMTGTGKDHELSIVGSRHFIVCRDVFNNEMNAVVYV